MRRSSRVFRVVHCLMLSSLCGAGMFTTAASQGADARYGIEAEVVMDDNINRGQSGYEKSDTIASVEGNVSRSVLLSYRTGLLLRGGLRYENYSDFGDLSNISLNGHVAYRFQPNPGYSGTSFELAAQAQVLKHADSEIRDGYRYSLSGSLGKHITDRVKLGGGISFDERSADTGDVFNTSSNRLWLSADYRLAQATLYGSATRIDGDHVITTGNGTYPGLSNYAAASAFDSAFTGAFGSFAPWAYRLEGTTTAYELGVNFPMGSSQALDLSVRSYDTEADLGGPTYDGTQLRATYFYRF